MAHPKNWWLCSAAHAQASKAAKIARAYSGSPLLPEVEILDEEPIDLTSVIPDFSGVAMYRYGALCNTT